MDDDDIGTVRWFGKTWHAPVNDPRTQVLTPIGAKCVECGIEIGDNASGLVLNAGAVVYHRECFFRALGLTDIL